MDKIMIKTFQKDALLYNQLDELTIQCNTCWHKCKITSGNKGKCNTRINVNGKLMTLNYGLVSSISINPIEKKPLFHYYPGSKALTIGSVSCNFNCPWCQNWIISKIYPENVTNPKYISPEDLVKIAKSDDQIQGISFSFNEPALWLEYVLDVFELCDNQFYQMLVTNGYMTQEALELLIDSGMTGMSVTVKGDKDMVKKYCGARVNHVWKNIERAHRKGVHIEIICLIIPRVNDSSDFFHQISKMISNIDKNIPLHFTRFFPDYKFNNVEPSPVMILEEAHSIAKQQGLKYVYLGNVFGHPLENSYCYECDELLIERTGYGIELKLFQGNKCFTCGREFLIYINDHKP